MLNYYRRFLPHAAEHQAPLHDVLSGPKVKGSHPITWTPELHKAFEECKASLSRATLLAHPDPSAPLALVTDASTSAMGAMLQQHVKNAWQLLGFFSWKLNSVQKKYSAYNRELLAIYEAVKHFRHMQGSAPLHHLHRPQTSHLRLPAEKGQMLTTTIQPPRFHSTIHNRHPAHLWTGQRCCRRTLPRRVRH